MSILKNMNRWICYVCLSVLLCGCSLKNAEKQEVLALNEKNENTYVEKCSYIWDEYRTMLKDDKYSSLEAYISLFDEDEEFYLIRLHKYASLSSLDDLFEESGYRISDFSIIDMNDDGIDELIIRATIGPGFTFVFSKIDDRFYASFFSAREMLDLQRDGRYIGSGGAGCTYFCRLEISESEMESVCFEMRDNNSSDNNWTDEYLNEYLEENYSDPAEWYEINYVVE